MATSPTSPTSRKPPATRKVRWPVASGRNPAQILTEPRHKTREYPRKRSEPLRKTPEPLRKLADYLRKTPEYLRKLAEYLRKTPEYLRKLSEYLRKTPEYLRILGFFAPLFGLSTPLARAPTEFLRTSGDQTMGSAWVRAVDILFGKEILEKLPDSMHVAAVIAR